MALSRFHLLTPSRFKILSLVEPSSTSYVPPHDDVELELLLNGKSLAALPENSYTVSFISPGEHELVCLGPGAGGRLQVFTDVLRFHAAPEQRLIVLLSGITERKSGLASLLQTRTRTARGSRAWSAATEVDARSLIPVLKLVHSSGT